MTNKQAQIEALENEMGNWCIEHPWLTTWIITLAIACIAGVICKGLD